MGDAAGVRRCHADYFVGLAEAAGPGLRSRDQVATADRVERDVDNFRAVFDWAVESSSADHALRLVAPLGVNGHTIGYPAMDWADTAVDIHDAAAHALFPIGASLAIRGAVFRGHSERAETLVARLEEAEAALGSRQPAARNGPGMVAFFRGDFEVARDHAHEWIERARESGDRYELGHALILYGATFQASDPDRMSEVVEEAVAIGRDDGITSVLSIGLSTLAQTRTIETPEDAASVLALLDEAIALGMTIGDRHGVSVAVENKANVALRLGQWELGLRASADAAEQSLAFGIVTLLGRTCAIASLCLIGLGRPEPATVLLAAADVRDDRSTWPEWSLDLATAAGPALLEGLGEQRLVALRDRGSALENAELVAYLRAEADRVLAEVPASSSPHG